MAEGREEPEILGHGAEVALHGLQFDPGYVGHLLITVPQRCVECVHLGLAGIGAADLLAGVDALSAWLALLLAVRLGQPEQKVAELLRVRSGVLVQWLVADEVQEQRAGHVRLGHCIL